MKDFSMNDLSAYCLENCPSKDCDGCENFIPVADKALDEIISHLKEHIVPAPTRKMPRVRASSRLVNQKGDSLYSYYVAFINDILSEIRKGKMAYAFHLYQIEDIMRYEPDISVTYFDGIYYITKNL